MIYWIIETVLWLFVFVVFIGMLLYIRDLQEQIEAVDNLRADSLDRICELERVVNENFGEELPI